jgi:hypothetical protein
MKLPMNEGGEGEALFVFTDCSVENQPNCSKDFSTLTVAKVSGQTANLFQHF